MSMAFRKRKLSGSLDVGLQRRPRVGESPEVGCFFGYELFSVAKNTLFTRKHLPYLGNLKHCKARK